MRELETEQKETELDNLANPPAAGAGGSGKTPSIKSGSDPRKVMIPKVKMARADADDADVIKLIEHLK